MVKIDTSAIIGLAEDFKISEEALDIHLKQGLTIAGSQVQSAARGLVPVDTSALKISIQSSVRVESNGMSAEVGPTQPYGREIEFGRPPGTQVSPAALMGWAKRKGLNPYAVAKSIAKKGSPAQPFLFPAAEAQSDNVLKILAQAVVNAFNATIGKK